MHGSMKPGDRPRDGDRDDEGVTAGDVRVSAVPGTGVTAMIAGPEGEQQVLAAWLLGCDGSHIARAPLTRAAAIEGYLEGQFAGVTTA